MGSARMARESTSESRTLPDRSSGGADSLSPSPDRNRPSALSLLSPYLPVSLPKYFSSEWSHAQYRLPTRNPHAETLSLGGHGHTDETAGLTSDGEEKCVVGWIEVGPAVGGPSGGKENVTPSPAQSSRRSSSTAQEFAGGSKGVRTLTPTPSSNSSPSRGAPQSGQASGGVEHQLVALTYSGGWYRLALPSSTSAPAPPSSSSSSRRQSSDLGDDDEEGADVKPGVQCRLVEFRRFGQESAFGGSAGGKGFGS